ncbi:MAG: glycosyltransferase [Deltaproteobacteria bacterium]
MPCAASDWPDTLLNASPAMSAALPMVRWQRAVLVVLSAGLFSSFFASAEAAMTTMMTLLTPAFAGVALLRGIALWQFWFAPRPANSGEKRQSRLDGDLPVYSILVPLYREAHMAAALADALDRLDWPVEKRDIVFITEAEDHPTRRALAIATQGRPGMRIVSVPAGDPRTKPRALMYALPLAEGEFVVVFDAEDVPEPDQLRLAYARFQDEGAALGCLQARLNIYNARKNWITRQFALEYTALFDALLPAVERLKLPLPLGGTSNHFRREALLQTGGWDPYNVTEDADLGVRLARQGWDVKMLGSVTWEEAPQTFHAWFGQRTRWLKGWMQTSLVHLRQPARLWSELGARGFLGFNVLLAGVIISALVHPLFYAYAAWKLHTGELALWPPDGWPAVIWWAGVVNLAVSYAVGIALTVVAAGRRHGWRLAAWAVLVPVYWMMISVAAYRAMIDLGLRPFHWRKTDHTGRAAVSDIGRT